MIRRAETPPRDPQQIIEDQAREIERLREDLRRSEAERQRLRRENEKLKDELEAARRAVYRQAAPFSRGDRTAVPKRSGRKAGRAYGRRAHRRVPSRVDETYEAPLPRWCPHCSGAIHPEGVATQYQEELPVQRPLVRRFDIHIGRCTGCRRRVQGRHPLQTSDALGAAAVHLGPQAVAFAVLLNKRYGLPYGKIAALLRDRFGLTITRGGLVQAIHRAARQAQPTYDTLCATVRGSPVVTIDETSWRVDAVLQWLWVWVTAETTVYAILPGRGLAQAASVIGHDYPGVVQRDGWHSYRYLTAAAHQTCLAHLLRRCRALLLDVPDHPFVTAVKAILQAALATRDAVQAGTVSVHGLAVARGHYLARLGRLLERRPARDRRIRLFHQHLVVEFEAIFSFLFEPTLDATNWRAEHALRPAVVTRKMCGGGNRTQRGATSQQILASVLRTADQRGLDATDVLVTLLTAP
ncbi:MAG TPA: IS66 family transposase, partial [Vicinamibacterales bacterium]|nr:IS66 family transposase [Vicinamibacterales bacterium]